MSVSIQCPNCRANLRLGQPVPPGRKLRCPKCNESFTVADQAPPRERAEKRPEGQAPAKPRSVMDALNAVGAPPQSRERTAPAGRRRQEPEDDFEFVDDDEVIEAEPARPKPAKKRGRKKRKNSGSRTGVMLAGIGAAVLIAGGVIAAGIFLLGGGGGRELLAYVPADSRSVMSLDLNGLRGNPALKSQMGRSFEQGGTGTSGNLTRAGLSTDDVDQVLISTDADDRKTVAFKFGKAVELDQLARAFEDPKKVTEHGRDCYKVSIDGHEACLFMPSAQVAVVTVKQGATLAELMEGNAAANRPAGLSDLIDAARGGDMWMVYLIEPDQAREAGDGIAMAGGFLAGGADLSPLASAVRSARGVTVRADASGGDVDVEIGLACADGTTASQAADSLSKLLDENREKIKSQIQRDNAKMSPAIDTMRVKSSGSRVVLRVRVPADASDGMPPGMFGGRGF